MGFVDRNQLQHFAVGFSYVADLNAPGTLSPVTDAEGNTTFEIDDDGRYVVAESGSLGVIGIDVEADVLNTDVLDILLYTDYNMIGDAGNGLHIGTLMDFNFSLGISVRMPYGLVPSLMPTISRNTSIRFTKLSASRFWQMAFPGSLKNNGSGAAWRGR